MAPTLGGGTQDTDFNKGFAKGIVTNVLYSFPRFFLLISFYFSTGNLPTIGGGTQDTDFNKGFTKGFF